MKNKKYFAIPIFMFLVVGVFAFGFSINLNSNSLVDGVTYNSMVKVETTADFDGRQTPVGEWELVSLHPNLLYDTGKEAIEDYLMEGTGGGDAFDWIELGDAALAVGAPQANGGEAYTAHALDGLVKVAGVSGTNAASGNWTIYNEFTSTADNQLTNISHLLNDDDDVLAGNTFTLVTLQTGDKINVTWDVWVV